MKAMILAAGFGNRMKPLSDRLPKPLLPVLERPLIDYTIEHIKKATINRIGVNTHFGADRLETYLNNGTAWNVEITTSREKRILGTGGGIRVLGDFLSDEGPFLVYNSDVLSEIRIEELIAFHFQREALVTLALCNCPSRNNVTLSPENLVVDLRGKLGALRPGIDKNLTFMGISIVDPTILNLIPPNKPFDIIHAYLDLIQRRPGSVAGLLFEKTYWIDIGTPVAYLEAHRDILIDKKPISRSFIQQGTTYIGKRSVIEGGAHLEGFVSLGTDCLVKKNAFLKNCVVWNNTVVENDTALESGVIDGSWKYSIADK